MDELHLLDELEKTISILEKKRLLIIASEANPRVREIFDVALNFFRKYHIRRIDISGYNPDSEDRHAEFMAIVRIIETKEVIGNTARTLVENFLNNCNQTQQKWYARAIQKDLRIGMSVDLVNDCGLAIPKFDVMLAKDAKQSKKAKKIVAQGVYVSPKFDGYRCLAVFDGADVTLYTRNGAIYENFPLLHSALSNALVGKAPPIVLDGEIMSSNFQEVQKSAFSSVKGTSVDDINFHIFGCVPFHEWNNDKFEATTVERYQILENYFFKYLRSVEGITFVPQKYTKDWDEILKLEEEYRKQGHEGVMALSVHATYYKGRAKNKLLKFKTFKTMDCVVIDKFEGQGKLEGVLGGLKVLQEDGKTICGVGVGFTDDDREYMWKHFNKVKGRICEIRYQNLTEDGAMRFPVFSRWRDLGNGVKI